MPRFLTLSTLAAAAIASAATANATVIYATNGLSRPFSEPDTLIRFDASNPAGWVTIGSMGVPNIGFGGLAFDATGNLWAYASFYRSTGGAASGLYRVDINTGAATVQGTISSQSLQDLAYNPVDGNMYGINTQNNVSRLYRINLVTGGVTSVGIFTGLESAHHLGGFAIDSAGNMYVQDMRNDRIYRGSGLNLTELYTLPQDTNFSQGMTIDWSRDNQGYHAAVGYGEYPFYFSQLNTFSTDGSGYHLGPSFGPALEDGLPPVQAGDLAIMPIPAPGTLLPLVLAGAAAARRRR